MDNHDFLKQEESLKNAFLGNSKKAFNLLVKSMLCNNQLVLNNLIFYKELIKNHKPYKKNFIFHIIEKNRLNWLQKVWDLDCLPHFTLNGGDKCYMELALTSGKLRIFDFLYHNSRYNEFSDEKIKSLSQKYTFNVKRNKQLKSLSYLKEKQCLLNNNKNNLEKERKIL